MNPPIFVSVSTEPGISSAERVNIRYDEFVRKLLKPLPENLSICHIGLGLAGELGELFSYDCDEIEELGDYVFYLQAALNHYNLTEDDCQLDKKIIVAVCEFIYRTGQLIDCIKREYIYNKPRDLNAIKQCIGYISMYLQDQYDWKKVPKSVVLQNNALKLEKRYAGLYYSDEAAIARADKL